MINNASNDLKVAGDLINAKIGENRFGAEIAGIGVHHMIKHQKS